MNLNNLRAAKDSLNAACKRVRVYSGNFAFLNPRKMTVKEVQAEFELQRDIGRDTAMALMHAREVLDDLERYLIASELKRLAAIKLLAGPEALDGLPTETAAAESPLANRPIGISCQDPPGRSCGPSCPFDRLGPETTRATRYSREGTECRERVTGRACLPQARMPRENGREAMPAVGRWENCNSHSKVSAVPPGN